MSTQLANDAYGRSVVLQNDNVTYIVTDPNTGGSFTLQFAGGTPLSEVYQAINAMAPSVLPLALAITQNLLLFQSALQLFIQARYPDYIRLNLHAMYDIASTGGTLGGASLPNRATYIKQVFTWAQTVTTYAASYVSTVQGLTDPNVVTATRWDFTSLIASDPGVTPVGALAINS